MPSDLKQDLESSKLYHKSVLSNVEYALLELKRQDEKFNEVIANIKSGIGENRKMLFKEMKIKSEIMKEKMESSSDD